MTSLAAISAAIIAGGSSRRFGSDKALAPSPIDGRPILATIVEHLRSIAAEVFIVAPGERPYSEFGVPIVTEPLPGQGPLGGLGMALQVATHDRCLVVACDLPFLNRELLGWMAEAEFDADALVPIVRSADSPGGGLSDGQPQTLHAIYRTACLPAVDRLLSGGERRMGRLLEEVRVAYLLGDEIRSIDPTLRSFTNVNSVADLADANSGLAPGNRTSG